MARNNHVERTARDLNPSLISRPSGIKDRHTMVLTSKGARHRRMRLSVGTAIKLYSVQDMLGFEQPSQAVEWLLEKSQDAIRQLPQLASISSSHILSQYLDSINADPSLSCRENFSTSSQDNTSTADGEFLLNLYQQMLATKSCNVHKSSTPMTTEANNKFSIVLEDDKEQRSLALSSVDSNRRTRESANAVLVKQVRAKARERARERTRQRDSQQNGICSTLQPSSVSPWSQTFSLQDNTSSSSSLNMINGTTDENGNNNAFINSLMLTKDSILDSQSRLCLDPPPSEIQCSSLDSPHYYTPQQEGNNFESTRALCGLDLGTLNSPSGTFPEAVATTSSTEGVFSTYPLEYTDLQSCYLCQCCQIPSIEMPCIYDGAVETLYESQNSSDSVFLQFK